MYTEETRRSIDWPSVIKKGLLILIIALVIFLIVWLLVRNNDDNVNVNVNDDNNTNNGTLTNPDAYSNEFINGFHYVHDIAKDYFLIKELPLNGGTIKYTLKELIDKGLILPFTYKNNETCDVEASYVTVTNNNGKYNMTTTLVCGHEVAKTTEELGCNQLCVSGSCKVTVTEPKPASFAYEYQFRQAYNETESVYVCPSGYTKSMNGNNVICVKGNETTVKATKKTEYTCPEGYTKSGNGDSAICTAEKNKTTGLVCPEGYTNQDGKCTKQTTGTKVETTDFICPSGYTKSGSGASTKCTKKVAGTTTQSANPICPSGYSQSGSGSSIKCTKTVSSSTTQSAKSVFSYYSCSSGTNLGNGKCRHYSTSHYYTSYTTYKGSTYNGCTYSGPYTSSCSSYSGCKRTYHQYYCSKQFSYDTSATAVYVCPSGYSASGWVGYGTTCYRTVPTTSTQSANPICPSGYSQSGSGSSIKCTKTVSTSKDETTNPICPTGYNKNINGTNCTRNVTVPTTDTKDMVCPEGFTRSGNTCTAKETLKKKVTKHIEYICPSGYTKFGIGPDSKCTKGSTSTVNPTTQTKSVTKYRYKWSCDTALAGWERTGNYRKSTKCTSTSTNTNEEVIVK